MALKIGDASLRPVLDAGSGKRTEKKAPAESAAPAKGGFDTADFRANRLAVMPRMSSVGGRSAQRVQSGAVETLLKGSAEELDDYFAEAYGFKR